MCQSLNVLQPYKYVVLNRIKPHSVECRDKIPSYICTSSELENILTEVLDLTVLPYYEMAMKTITKHKAEKLRKIFQVCNSKEEKKC